MAKKGRQNRLGNHPLFWLILLGLTLISGCFDNEDIDRRMIVSNIGIDVNTNDQMLVTFKMPIGLRSEGGPQTNTADKKDYIIRSASAQGVFPALIDIQNRNDLEIFIGQCRAIVLGESLVKKGVRPVLDFFNRMPTFPPSAFVVMARPSAEVLLKVNWPEQERNTQHIRSFFSTQSNQIYGVKKWMLFRNIYDPLQDAVLPIVTPSDENSSIKMVGLAVFHKDRMVGELNDKEAAFWAMLRNLKKANRLVIPLSGSIPTTFQVVTGEKKLKVAYPGYPLFKLELKLHAFLGELGGYQPPLSPRDLHQLENQSALYLEKNFLALLTKLQTFQSDPLDLGNNFRIQQPKYFSLQKWPGAYRRAKFKVRVKIFIERLGVLK